MLLEGPMLEKFMKSCILWEKVHARVGEGHQEGVAEMMCDELTTTYIPHPHALGGEQVEELGAKLSPRRMEWGKVFSRFIFISQCPTFTINLQ